MTIAKLYPTNLDTIEFGASFWSAVNTGFYLIHDTLNFNEASRKEYLYSETRYGGKAINFKTNLTPITFTVIVFGSTRDLMLSRSEQLNQSVGNIKGGLFEYRPDDANTSTFYTYEASAVPQLTSLKFNRWDDLIKEHAIFAMSFDVTLMTQPIGHSQLFTSITPTDLIITNNGDTFDLLDIKGDIPALVQVKLANINSGITLNRFYICSRSSIFSTLSTLTATFEAESGATVGTWTTDTEAGRSGGSIQRFLPFNANWNRLMFNISSSNQLDGLITVLPIVKATSLSFLCRLAVYIDDSLVWASSNIYSPEVINKWHIMYAGEFNYPPIVLSDDVSATLRLTLEVMLPTGSPSSTDTFEVDMVQVMFSDEAIQQIDVTVDSTYGVTYGQELFLETDLDNMRKAIVTDGVGNVQRFSESIYGTLALTAYKDTRFFLAFQRLDDGGDLHSPNDSLAIETNIIYRTTYPFRD